MKRIPMDLIKSITFGVNYLEEKEGKIYFHRFSKEQEDMYQRRNPDFYKKAFATAGVSLEFTTDSKTLSLTMDVRSGSSRDYYGHSIFVNGQKIGELSGHMPTDGTVITCSGNFPLGSGMKEVRIQFPWSAASALTSLDLDEESQVIPAKKTRNMLIYGDSITQGYDSASPENAYAVLLTAQLNAHAINKAIGGEIFWPELASTAESIYPDLITVAYGTNDWSKCSFEEVKENCYNFYKNLCAAYPNTPIYVLSPIWRADLVREEKVDFREVHRYLEEIAQHFPQLTLLDGFHYVPHEPKYFWDEYLHPNDAGFRCYMDGLWEDLKKYI